ncbi:hypothetical protein CDL15_Pgr010920 [Punica granatum]|uniref:KOW domain-containing protein n=1 Tax=Punica granatum TaxID=22663 RepID=A0A218XN51_PUNGR|nr:hypothetical protein CDL15_Pgr010920 [Punica granatum]
MIFLMMSYPVEHSMKFLSSSAAVRTGVEVSCCCSWLEELLLPFLLLLLCLFDSIKYCLRHVAQKLIQNWKILRGDNVMIIRGKDKGETGVIKRVKKHIKQGQGHEGGIFTVEAPLHVSNVQVVDPVTGNPCKIGVRYLEDGTKVRVSRGQGASGSIIPRPEILKIRTTPRPTVAGPKDTPMDVVLEKTYDAKTGKGMPDL